MKETFLTSLTGSFIHCFSRESTLFSFAQWKKAFLFVSSVSADNIFVQKGAGPFLRAGIVFVLGFIHLFFPEQMWNWECGHLFKDKQPTRSGLLMYRVCGAIAIVISVIIFLKG